MAEEYRLSYTGQQVDEAIGKALTGIPTVTIALSQAIGNNQVQLTDEQYQILMNNKQVIFDGTALGMPALVATFNNYYDDEGADVLEFIFPFSEPAYHIRFHKITVISSTKIATLDYDGIYASYAEQAGETTYAFSVHYVTTAPSSANTSNLKIVVLSSEPATRYAGYLYIITGSN